MSELTITAPAMLDSLASEARYYSEAAANNLFQLARVLTEAKQLVPHGQWRAWLEANAGCSERTAQQMMQAYTRYGANPAIAKLDRSKVFKLLALPEGMEEGFLAANDVEGMSAREVDAAVKAAVTEARIRAEMEIRDMKRTLSLVSGDADQQRRRAEKAEADLRRVMADPPLPEDVAERLADADRQQSELREELGRLNEAAQDTIAEANMLRRTNATLQNNIRVLSDDLVQAEEERDRLRTDLDKARQQIQAEAHEDEREVRLRMIRVELARLDARERQLQKEYKAYHDVIRDNRERLQMEMQEIEKGEK